MADETKPTKRLRGRKKSLAVRAVHRRAEIMALTLKGWSTSEIAKHMGIGLHAVRKQIDKSLTVASHREREYTDRYRELVRRRYEAALRVVWDQQFVDKEAAIEERELGLQATKIALTINDQLAKLLALNLPAMKSLELTGPDGGPISIAAEIAAAVARPVEILPEDHYPTLDAEAEVVQIPEQVKGGEE